MADARGLLGDSLAFTKAVGSGAWDAGTGMVKGLGELAKGGYELATDANARDSAWETTKQLADAAGDYGKSVIKNPGEAYQDARDGTLAAYDRFETAKDLAAAEGRSAEFFGDMAGGALFEVGSILVPVGLAAKAGKLGKVASIADEVADAAKAAKNIENVEDVVNATQKAKTVSATPAIKELDDKVSAVQKCPVSDCDDIGGKSADVPNKINRGLEWFEDVALNATMNPDSNKLVLGHFAREGTSYQKVAAHYKSTYFKVDDWNSVTKGLSGDEIWRINETFLDQQLMQGKQILFSQNPLEARPNSFFEKEVNYIQELGYKFKQKNQWTWEAVR